MHTLWRMDNGKKFGGVSRVEGQCGSKNCGLLPLMFCLSFSLFMPPLERTSEFLRPRSSPP